MTLTDPCVCSPYGSSHGRHSFRNAGWPFRAAARRSRGHLAGAADRLPPCRGRSGTGRAYLRDIAPFPGLTTPDRRARSRTVPRGTPVTEETDRTAVAPGCRRLPEREYQHFAVDPPRRHVRRLSPGFPLVTRCPVPTAPRWDTVDLLAAADAALRTDMDAWARERGKPFDAARPVSDDRLMFRYAFPHAASAVADATKAAVLITVAAAAGARS
ncbi:DNA alkylation repair protein [Streptomyces sp. NPDC102365]|uniref:DNA alkylation repair protein n=1 Tax=Streptomyces sp. NPDC102365 TaxID=3366162 RepID=UPI0037FB613B